MVSCSLFYACLIVSTVQHMSRNACKNLPPAKVSRRRQNPYSLLTVKIRIIMSGLFQGRFVTSSGGFSVLASTFHLLSEAAPTSCQSLSKLSRLCRKKARSAGVLCRSPASIALACRPMIMEPALGLVSLTKFKATVFWSSKLKRWKRLNALTMSILQARDSMLATDGLVRSVAMKVACIASRSRKSS